MKVETVRDDGFACNVYRVGDSLVDAGDDADRLPPADEIDAVYLTHAHHDHGGALKDYDAPVHVHPAEADAEPLPDGRVRTVEEGDVVRMDGAEFEVLHTPGHSPGSVCYRCPQEGIVFSGDLLFENGAPGSTEMRVATRKRYTNLSNASGRSAPTARTPGTAGLSVTWKKK